MFGESGYRGERGSSGQGAGQVSSNLITKLNV